jgi:hypothetical protein
MESICQMLQSDCRDRQRGTAAFPEKPIHARGLLFSQSSTPYVIFNKKAIIAQSRNRGSSEENFGRSQF